MTVEIRELILRAKITSEADPDRSRNSDTWALSEAAKAEIIAACTAQVLRTLKREQER